MCTKHIITSDASGKRIEYTVKTKYNYVYLLNSPIITGPGLYKYTEIDAEEARDIVHQHIGCWESAIGHQTTAQLLYYLLDADVTVNRIEVILHPGDAAIVLKLKQRLPEGTVITDKEQLTGIGYQLGLLERIL